MDQETIRTIVAVSVPVGGVVVWLLRLEGRHNAHEGVCEERQKRMDERHEEMKDQLDRIDKKLDRLLVPPR